MAAKCFIVVSSSLVQDCSGGSGGLSRAVTDNSLGVLGAASVSSPRVFCTEMLLSATWTTVSQTRDGNLSNSSCTTNK